MTQAFSLKTHRRLAIAAFTLAALGACETSQPADLADEPPEPGVVQATRDGPEGGRAGACWGKTVSPAVIETITERVQIKPAKISDAGTVTELPVYRDESRQQILTPRQDNWFETPCPDVLTAEFTASLQRALAARGLYDGAVSGDMSAATRDAIRRYQVRIGGPASEVLSVDTARSLGLVAVPRLSDSSTE